MKYIILLAILSAQIYAVTVKTVCSSGCDYTTIQAAVNVIPNPRTDTFVIEIAAGQTFNEAVNLKKQTTNGHQVVIRSSRMYSLPSRDRINPTTHVSLMPLISSPSNTPTITFEQGASYYRLEGLNITWFSGANGYYIFTIGTQGNSGTWIENQTSLLGHHIEVDRCWIHGIEFTPSGNFTSCMSADGGQFEMTNSVINNCYNSVGKEAHAFQSYNGTGPFYLTNNQITATQIGSLFGGSDPTIKGLMATGIYTYGNYYYRPYTWRVTSGSAAPSGTCLYDANGGESYNRSDGHWWLCASGTWTDQGTGTNPSTGAPPKNHWEVKNGFHAVSDGNFLTHGWFPGAQNQRGACFLLNQVDNHTDWAKYSFITLENNWCENVPVFASQGRIGSNYYSTNNEITIRNNVISKTADPSLFSNGSGTGNGGLFFFQIDRNGPSYPFEIGREMIYNNTYVCSPNATNCLINGISTGDVQGGELVLHDNIMSWGQLGLYAGTNGNFGNGIDYSWPTNKRSFSKNVAVNDQGCTLYSSRCPDKVWYNPLDFDPDGNGTPQMRGCTSCSTQDNFTNVQMTNFSANDYSLTSSSPYKGWGHYGLDPGADTQVVTWSTQGAVSGTFNPYLNFRVRNLSISSTTANYRYTSPSTETCTTTIANNPSYTSPIYNSSDSGGNPDRTLAITGLTTKTRYWWRIICGASSYRRSGVFTTN